MNLAVPPHTSHITQFPPAVCVPARNTEYCWFKRHIKDMLSYTFHHKISRNLARHHETLHRSESTRRNCNHAQVQTNPTKHVQINPEHRMFHCCYAHTVCILMMILERARRGNNGQEQRTLFNLHDNVHNGVSAEAISRDVQTSFTQICATGQECFQSDAHFD